MFTNVASNRPAIRRLLTEHPRVRGVVSGDRALTWQQGDWVRHIRIGHPELPLYGLTELVDNNPLVCADEFSVPSAAATIALIALGPLAAAGMILDRPTLVINTPPDDAEIDFALAALGFPDGVITQFEDVALGSVVAGTAMVEIPDSVSFADLNDLYEERFGRSFYVRRDQTSEWDPSLVEALPHAVFRMSLAPDSPRSLLTVRVLADAAGKCGAAQVIHAMNVMSGLEESLGIA